jgi:hypothetical protein
VTVGYESVVMVLIREIDQGLGADNFEQKTRTHIVKVVA